MDLLGLLPPLVETENVTNASISLFSPRILVCVKLMFLCKLEGAFVEGSPFANVVAVANGAASEWGPAKFSQICSTPFDFGLAHCTNTKALDSLHSVETNTSLHVSHVHLRSRSSPLLPQLLWIQILVC